MTKEEFVEIIRKVVAEDSTNGVTSVLQVPPGRRPLQKLVDMSKWYNNLNENDKKVVGQIIKVTVETAVFHFLCVLDGVAAIENENKGELKLFYENKDVKVLLNDPEEEFLHDLFNIVV